MSTHAIVGELTVLTAAEQKESLLAALEAGQPVEVSLAGVGEIDTAGLQLLLAVKREAVERRAPVRFVSHSAAVHQVLTFCRLDTQLAHATGNHDSRKDVR